MHSFGATAVWIVLTAAIYGGVILFAIGFGATESKRGSDKGFFYALTGCGAGFAVVGAFCMLIASWVIYDVDHNSAKYYARAVQLQELNAEDADALRIVLAYDGFEGLPHSSDLDERKYRAVCAETRSHVAYRDWLIALDHKAFKKGFALSDMMRGSALHSFRVDPIAQPQPWRPWKRQARPIEDDHPVRQLGNAIVAQDLQSVNAVLSANSMPEGQRTIVDSAHLVMAREAARVVIDEYGESERLRCVDLL